MTYEDGLKILNRYKVMEKLGSKDESLNYLLSSTDIKTLACENRDFAESLNDYLSKHYEIMKNMQKVGDICVNSEDADEISLFTEDCESSGISSYVLLSKRKFSEESLNTRFLTQIGDRAILNCKNLRNTTLNEYMCGHTILDADMVSIYKYINPNADVVVTNFTGLNIQTVPFCLCNYSHIRSLRAEGLKNFTITVDNTPILIATDSIIMNTSVKEIYLSFESVSGKDTHHPVLVPAPDANLEPHEHASNQSNRDCYCITDYTFDELVEMVEEKSSLREFSERDFNYLMFETDVMMVSNNSADGFEMLDCIHISGVDLTEELIGAYFVYFGVFEAVNDKKSMRDYQVYKYHKVKIEYSDTDTPNVWDKLIYFMDLYDGKYVIFEVF